MGNYKVEDFDNLSFSEEIFNELLDFNELQEIEDFIINPNNKKFQLRTVLLTCEDENQANLYNLIKSSFSTKKRKDFLLLTKQKMDRRRNSKKLFFGYFRPTNNSHHYLLHTFLNVSDIESLFIRKFIRKQKIMDILWLTHNLTFDFIDYIQKEIKGDIFEYRGSYLPTKRGESKIRPTFSRKIHYTSEDCYYFIKEQHSQYGISADSFYSKIGNGELYFNRKNAIIGLKQLDLEKLNIFIYWIFEKSEEYLKEVREFKEKIYTATFSKRNYKLSNNLVLNFSRELEDTVLLEIKKLIEQEFEIIEKVKHDTVEGLIFSFTLLNKYKKALIKTTITPNFCKISHDYNSNFISVFSLLDIFDSCQPQYNISVMVP